MAAPISPAARVGRDGARSDRERVNWFEVPFSGGEVQAEGFSAFPAAGAFGGIIESQAAMRYKYTPEEAVPWRGAIN
jgi:hypothetical protein